MTSQDLARIGRALFGSTFAPDLAKRLDIHIRNMHRYLDGSRPVPEWMPASLAAIAEERAREMKLVGAEMRDAVLDATAQDA